MSSQYVNIQTHLRGSVVWKRVLDVCFSWEGFMNDLTSLVLIHFTQTQPYTPLSLLLKIKEGERRNICSITNKRTYQEFRVLHLNFETSFIVYTLVGSQSVICNMNQAFINVLYVILTIELYIKPRHTYCKCSNNTNFDHTTMQTSHKQFINTVFDPTNRL